MDPYEQQLLTVFNSYDHEKLGSLDSDGLGQLCSTLQLDDHSPELINSLLDESTSRATFQQFKSALLLLLDNLQQQPGEHKSPEREVSPKYVYGSKKYGRRSRPRHDAKPEEIVVQRSNSEVSNSKKRRTSKVKRCASLQQEARLDDELECTEEMLREAWRNLGVGHDGYLNQSELIRVCDAIGLHKLAKGVIRQLSDKLVDFDQRISFQELLEALQEDDTWSEVLETSSAINQEMFPNSATFQFVTLGPDGNGTILAENLIEMWELVGITAPKELILDLGFNDREISVLDLAKSIEKELKNQTDTFDWNNPSLVLVQANLALYQSEIKTLKLIFEQTTAERDKLRHDVTEANNRAKLLAQEVDDNHSKMERKTQNQIKVLEARHGEILREVTAQNRNEKDQLGAINQKLETRILNLEAEIGKLKTDLTVAQNYSKSIETENQSLVEKIKDLEGVKEMLNGRIEGFESERLKFVEMEEEQLAPLLEQLGTLQGENAELRDRNDEMVTEIENLMQEVSTMRAKLNSDQMEDDGGVLLGAKRRSGSPSTPTFYNVIPVDGNSPRLGKVRKFGENLDIMPAFSSSESGFENDSFNENDLKRLQAKIVFLEQTLRQHSIPIPTEIAFFEQQHQTEESLKNRIQELESIISDLTATNKMIEELKSGSKDSPTNLTELLTKYETDNETLRQKCDDLEKCVDLLRNEYEKCEDYWQSKLDEEREIFEHEQAQSSDKLSDLIQKMAEYEEQFQTPVDARLPTIDENNLEKQFTDLEQEYEEYRIESENEIFKRDEEISALKQKLFEVSTGIEDKMAAKMGALSLNVVETTSLFASDALPAVESLSWQHLPSTSTSTPSLDSQTPCRPKRTRKHEKNAHLYKKNGEEIRVGEREQIVALPISTIHNLNGSLHHLEQRCRHLQMVLKQQHFYTEQNLQQLRQHARGEKVELQCLLRNNQEKLEYQVRLCNDQLERLTRSDILAKELYVENSYLIAKVQRLEKQCHLLAQYNANSSSV